MALNWAMLNDDRTPVPLPHESIIRAPDSVAEVILAVPEVPPTGSAPSGGSGGVSKWKETGRVWLTDQRFIFVSTAPKKIPTLDSLSVPLTSLLSTKFQQPLLGSNYLEIDIAPTGGGGLTKGTTAEVRLRDQGLFGFASALDKSRERAAEASRNQVEEGEGLPMYSSAPSTSTVANRSAASSGLDAPPAYDA